jgi:hypothetical protein
MIDKLLQICLLFLFNMSLFLQFALAETYDTTKSLQNSSEIHAKRENLCFGDPDESKKDFSIERFNKVVGKNNSKSILDWLKMDFALQRFQDFDGSGLLICRIDNKNNEMVPNFLLIQPAAGLTNIVHFTILDNKISQINAYEAYPYEKYIYDKSGNVYLLTLEETARHGELRFNYGIYNVSNIKGNIANITQLNDINQDFIITYSEPDILAYGGVKNIDTSGCWQDEKLPYGATGIDVATNYNKVISEDVDNDGYADLVFSYKVENCKTKQISSHRKIFIATEDGFKERP